MSDQEQKVLQILEGTSPDFAIPTLQIAKKVVGSNATTSQINSVLYGLQKQGKIDKVTEQGGKKPKWYKKPTGPPPIIVLPAQPHPPMHL